MNNSGKNSLNYPNIHLFLLSQYILWCPYFRAEKYKNRITRASTRVPLVKGERRTRCADSYELTKISQKAINSIPCPHSCHRNKEHLRFVFSFQHSEKWLIAARQPKVAERLIFTTQSSLNRVCLFPLMKFNLFWNSLYFHLCGHFFVSSLVYANIVILFQSTAVASGRAALFWLR